jgi:hypothetical protein
MVFLLGAGSPAELREVACNPKIFFYFFIFLFFYFFIFPPWGLARRTSAGLNHGNPPFDFEVAFAHLLPPNSCFYLYYYLRLRMSLIALFFFALTFGKPLNYFTCEKEDF